MIIREKEPANLEMPFGALDGFDLLKPKVSIAPTSIAGRWVYFLLGAFVAVAGSLSLLQLMGRWFANLAMRRRVHRSRRFSA
jgi:hypothetical protein